MGVPAWPVETSERGNLLLWNTSTELLLREEFSDRMLFIIRQTEAHASPFSWASSVRKCLGFTSRISQKKTFCYSQVHSPRMLQNKLKFNSSEHKPRFTELIKLHPAAL